MLYLTLLALGLGVAVGLARGGHIDGLAQVRIRLKWLALGSWLLQVALFVSPLAPVLDPFAAALHMLSALLIGVVVLANRRVPGMAVIGLGLLLNAAVYSANGGFMPVSDAALNRSGQVSSEAMLAGGRVQKTFLMAPDTPLWFLGDVVPVGVLGRVFSPGDLVAAFGVFVLVVGALGTTPKIGYVCSNSGSSAPMFRASRGATK
jgi:hypothetical protein